MGLEFFISTHLIKLTFQLSKTHNPHNQAKKHQIFSIKDYQEITDNLLDKLYPKHCPSCGIKLTKRISTRDYLIRCHQCHYQASRFSYTPLHHFKLPSWYFGWAVVESIIRYPQVLTSTEIRKRLGIAKNSATLLKRRVQLFCSQQMPKIRVLMHKELKDKFSDFELPRSEKEDITELVKDKPVVNADTCALFSASQRANKGRKRFKHSGLTASIPTSQSPQTA